jgi:hypothetical protein
MKSRLAFATLAMIALGFLVCVLSVGASARDVVLPAGTLLQCTLNEPNFSSASVAVGDPVLCHLRGQVEFGQQAFPRGSYLVGHLESAKDPGHFFGKGNLKLQFDRIGLPTGDLPLEAKIVATKGYKVDKDGKIDGKGHAKRDVVEWMLPPLWPWKVIMLPARGPRPKLKGETVLSMRLMDDVQIPQSAQTYGAGWKFFGRPADYSESANSQALPQLAVRRVSSASDSYAVPQLASATRITLPANAAPGLPLFVMKSGTVLSVGNYSYQDNRLTYTLAGGGGGVVSTDEVDWSATTRLNNQRGVRVTLHAGHPQTGTPGL